MSDLAYHLFRRMRVPLIVLITVYAISVLGFVLIPGQDDQGQPWHMDFFHAFYFVSFMGSTIGFGEIPYPFTDAQRFWALFSIYGTVVAWLFAIGSLLAIVQDPAFRAVMARNAFVRGVRQIRQPFYVVSGFGDSGALLLNALSKHGIRAVVIDRDQSRIDALKVQGLEVHVPALCADASDPSSLEAAGVRMTNCAGVIAITNDDEANLAVAITAKLFSRTRTVICRANHQDTADNMASFGTDHVINPFETFAERFARAIHSPSLYLLYLWLTSTEHLRLNPPIAPPRGRWIVCGYGRFGKAVNRALHVEGVSTVIIEADPAKTQPPEGSVIGRGTEAETLQEAGIENAVGVIAGTDHDANNLSIVLTARDLNPELFTVARRTRGYNEQLFDAAWLDVVMQPATIIAREVLALVTTPLLAEFLRLIRGKENDWANVLVSRISGVTGETPPATWTLTIGRHQTPAVRDSLEHGGSITLAHLLTDPRDRSNALPSVALLLKRGEAEELLPESSTQLVVGDRILFCGLAQAERLMDWTALNHDALDYVISGRERPDGILWRWLAERWSSPG